MAICDVSTENMSETKRLAGGVAGAGTRITTHVCDVSSEDQVLAFATRSWRSTRPGTSTCSSTTPGSGVAQLRERRPRRVGAHVQRLLVRRLLLHARLHAPARRQRRGLHHQHQQRERVLGIAWTDVPHTAYSSAKFAGGLHRGPDHPPASQRASRDGRGGQPGHIGRRSSSARPGAANPTRSPPPPMRPPCARCWSAAASGDAITDDQLRAAMHQMAVAFRDQAPTPAAQARRRPRRAADRHLARAGRTGAQALDRLVRAHPSSATSRRQALNDQGHMRLLDEGVPEPPTRARAMAYSPRGRRNHWRYCRSGRATRSRPGQPIARCCEISSQQSQSVGGAPPRDRCPAVAGAP